MVEYIKNPFELKFDPLDKDLRKELKEVFENRLARILWMGIKQRHLTSQYFESHCLDTSKLFEKLGVPDTTGKLKRILERSFNMTYKEEFLEELLPYLLGKKDLEYKVIR